MRNWNSERQRRGRDERKLPDYLWGIETLNNWIADTQRDRFQTTYEELKHRVAEVTTSYFASRLPMRNWNLEVKMKKLLVIVLLPDYLWGIETRESLRSDRGSWLPDYLWGIETFFFLSVEESVNASRLPMRNWNRNSGSVGNSSALLPDYLWGIETEDLSANQNRTKGGFQTTYEELKLLLTSDLGPELRFQTTYEELKHMTAFRRVFFESLPDYLWGIETPSSNRVPPRIVPWLPDYLWGIETVAILGVVCFASASRLPMRNWNKFRFGNGCQLYSASRLPMRNWN